MSGTLVNIALVGFFLLMGGVFSGSEIALVSLREGPNVWLSWNQFVGSLYQSP